MTHNSLANFISSVWFAFTPHLPFEYTMKAYHHKAQSGSFHLKDTLLALDSYFGTTLFTLPLLNNSAAFKEHLNQKATSGNIAVVPTPVELTLQYESVATSLRSRSKEAIFYTPTAIAKLMVETAFSITNPPKTILDPACGGGIFVLTAAKKLLENLHEKGNQRKELERTLYAIDRDPIAVETTRLLLLLLLSEHDIQYDPAKTFRQNIRCGNSLLEEHHYEGIAVKEAFPNIETFELIVGNPPYGLSRGEQISTGEKQALTKRYRHMLCGKPNKYMLFMIRALELLSPTGVTSLIVPNSWLGIKSGNLIREQLLSEKLTYQIDLFNEPVFSDPGVEAVILTASKKERSDSFAINVRRKDTEILSTRTCKVTECQKLYDSIIPVTWSAKTANIIGNLLHETKPLIDSDYTFQPMIALQAYATGKGQPKQSKEDVKNQIYHRSSKKDPEDTPYLQGRDIGRYTLHWSGQYLAYGSWLAEPQKKERFTGPRILIREILGDKRHTFQATYTEELYLYNKSVLHILGKEQELLALLAIINSALGSYLVQNLGKKSARKLFPKIVLDDLKHLLLPKDFTRFLPELAQAAKGQLGAPTHNRDEEINELVSDAYGVSQKEHEEILRSTKNRSRRENQTTFRTV